MAGPSGTVYTSADIDTLAKQLRSYIIPRQNEALKDHNYFCVAVSGGYIPTILTKGLLRPIDSSIEFEKWSIFFADERIVPLDHEQSNYKLLNDEFLSKIPREMGSPTVHTIDTSRINEEPQKIADRYQTHLRRTFTPVDGDFPIFDLVLLGCGPDGHTCSLFPGHDLLHEKSAWVAAEINSPKPPPRRISLTLPVVTQASNICFVAPAEETDSALRDVFSEQGPDKLPAAVVDRIGGKKVTWFTTEPAVEGMNLSK
ncbi:6-phosphogluconolactonase [Aspergillus sclerotialis]|uniref:6-phosphogluconolactonase n=1 Tax=Aspergillus sclerotialis TaxID=2070753 RepID=A0A3A3ABD8_9EURO|nr:6-phosphogluconolactonase [Aspergillus sclerotialis]